MHNLIIAGIGGQGINALATVIGKTCYLSNKSCQFTVHKGGAQSLGSVHAEIRIADKELPVLGPAIPAGQLDVMVTLDPWEGLRHLKLAHKNTRLWVETDKQPLFIERNLSKQDVAISTEPDSDPIEQLSRMPVDISFQSYRKKAFEECGTIAMANYYAGLDCLTAIGLDDVKLYQQQFFDTIPAARCYQGNICQ